MARSATARALQRLARAHAGVPPIARADFVRLALGGAAGTLLAPAFTVGTSLARERERVAIIGAGIAGLSCAVALHDAGITPTIFESSDRIGGRMHSEAEYWDDGQHTEWCGALIDSKHATMHALAHRFHIPLVDTFAPLPPHARDTAFFDGAYYSMEDADRDFAPVYKILQKQIARIGSVTTYDSATPLARELDTISMAQWIERYVPGGRASRFGKLVENGLMNENGADAAVQSALNLVYMLGIQYHYNDRGGEMNVLGYSDQRYNLAGGNQRLPIAMANSLPRGSVRFEHRLQAIRMRPTGQYELRFATPQGVVKETYDRVVLAIPFIILRNIDTGGVPFDARKRAAIQELGYGYHTKLHLQFHGRPWAGHGSWPDVTTGQIWTDLGFQCSTDFSLGQRGASGIIEGFTAGTIGLLDAPLIPYASA